MYPPAWAQIGNDLLDQRKDRIYPIAFYRVVDVNEEGIEVIPIDRKGVALDSCYLLRYQQGSNWKESDFALMHPRTTAWTLLAQERYPEEHLKPTGPTAPWAWVKRGLLIVPRNDTVREKYTAACGIPVSKGIITSVDYPENATPTVSLNVFTSNVSTTHCLWLPITQFEAEWQSLYSTTTAWAILLREEAAL